MIFNKKIVFFIIIVFINIIYAKNNIAIMVKSPDLDIYSQAVVENKLISHLSKISNYTVVERRDLPAIITEREFQECLLLLYVMAYLQFLHGSKRLNLTDFIFLEARKQRLIL